MCRGGTWLRFERATARTEDERVTIVPATRLFNRTYITFTSIMQIRQPILALKPRGDITRNQKQGYQWPQNRTRECVIQKELKKKNNNNCKNINNPFLFSYCFSVESLYDVTKLKDLFSKAKMARCRSRFVVPVILFEGKVHNVILSHILCFLYSLSSKEYFNTRLTSRFLALIFLDRQGEVISFCLFYSSK